MNLRRMLCPATVTVLLALAACREKATPAVPETPPPDLAAVTLGSHTDPQMGIQGVVPSGWVEFSPGHFQPEVPSTEPTLFGCRRVSGYYRCRPIAQNSIPWNTYGLGFEIMFLKTACSGPWIRSWILYVMG